MPQMSHPFANAEGFLIAAVDSIDPSGVLMCHFWRPLDCHILFYPCSPPGGLRWAHGWIQGLVRPWQPRGSHAWRACCCCVRVHHAHAWLHGLREWWPAAHAAADGGGAVMVGCRCRAPEAVAMRRAWHWLPRGGGGAGSLRFCVVFRKWQIRSWVRRRISSRGRNQQRTLLLSSDVEQEQMQRQSRPDLQILSPEITRCGEGPCSLT